MRSRPVVSAIAWFFVVVLCAVGFVLLCATVVLTVRPLGRYVLGRTLVTLGSGVVAGQVSYERIEGSLARGPTIVGLAVHTGSDSLTIRRLGFNYDPVMSLVQRAIVLSSCRVVEPKLYLANPKSQTPNPKSQTPGGKSKPHWPDARVGQFHLSDGSLFLDTVQRLDSVDVTFSAVSSAQHLLLSVAEVRATLTQESVSVRNVSGLVSITPDSLVVTDLVAMTARSRLRAGLELVFGRDSAVAEITDLSVSLPEFIKLPGRLQARGSVQERGGSFSGNVEYSADGARWQDISLPVLAGKVELKDSVFHVTASGADSVAGSVEVSGSLDLRQLDFEVTATVNDVAVHRLAKELPDVRVGAQAHVQGRGTDSISGDLQAAIPELGVDRLAASGTYVRKRQEVRLEQLEISGPTGSVSGSGSWTRGLVQAELALDTFDLATVGRLAGYPLAGKVTGSLSVAGQAESLDATGTLAVARPAAAGAKAGKVDIAVACTLGRSLHGNMQARASALEYSGTRLDSLQLSLHDQGFGLAVWRPGIHVLADGAAALGRDSVTVQVANLRVEAGPETVSLADPLRFRQHRDSLQLHLSASQFAGGSVQADVEMAGGRLCGSQAVLRELDLAQVKRLLGLGFDVAGVVSVTVAGCDTFTLALDGTGISVPSEDVRLSRVDAAVRVLPDGPGTGDGGRIVADHVWLVRAESSAVAETSTLSGSIKYVTAPRFEFGEADLAVKLRDPGTWVAAFLRQTVELRSGAVFGDLSLKGGLDQPRLGGRVRISQARLGVPVIGAVFDRVNAELVFDKNRVLIEKLSGRSDHGTAIVTGFVDLGRNWQVDSLRFHGDLTGTTINPQPEIYAVIGGSLDLDWAMGRPYSLNGTVDVEEALLAFGFGQSAGTGSPDTTMVFNVRVKADRDIWLRNQMADIEFGCDLTVRKTLTDMFYSGELDSRQGAVYYLDHTLTVTTGTVQFQNIARVNPDLNITAELPIRSAGSEGLPDKIVLTITGTLEQPSLSFVSEPPGWDEMTIASYLSLNVTPGQLSAMGGRDAVSKLLSERLLGYFQTQVSKRARSFVNLDYLDFESGLLGGQQTRVTVGKYIGRNLYVSYTQNFTGDIQPKFTVEYYIDRRNEIQAQLAEQNRTSLLYRFKLRY
jgi:autotransporter translocation and assembly factor TamB